MVGQWDFTLRTYYQKNYKVRIFETSRTAGGHARPFKFSNTIIEIFYHFFYKNDITMQ